MAKKNLTAYEAQQIAERTEDAYSFDRYAPQEWSRTAQLLAKRGHDARVIEAILRSKWMRWAADAGGRDYGKAKASDLIKWLEKSNINQTDLDPLVAETFGNEK